MKINEAVARAMSSNEAAFGSNPEARVAKMVKLTLAEIASEIASTKEGKVQIPGFGTFNVKQVEREKDGTKETRKRVFFVAKEAPGAAKKSAAKKAVGDRKPAKRAADSE